MGLDIEKSALEIVKADFKRKKIPLSKAGKYLTATNPYSAHSSAAKSFNASASKSATKPSINSSGGKGTTGPSPFLTYEANVTPYKRSRVESGTFGQEKLFTNKDTSAHSKKSAKPQIQKENETMLTPMNHEVKQIVDPILDDDFGEQIPITQFN